LYTKSYELKLPKALEMCTDVALGDADDFKNPRHLKPRLYPHDKKPTVDPSIDRFTVWNKRLRCHFVMS
jgi:hypothetical protein